MPCFLKTFPYKLPKKITSLRLSSRDVLLNVGATPIVILGLKLLMDVADLYMAKDKSPLVVRY